MPNIEWGAEIAVNGVRPEWLTGVQTAWLKTTHWTDQNHGNHVPAEKWSWRYSSDGRPCITAIRLPANHPYYLATSRGFTYWPGGETAPADWDGGEVLYSGGEVTSGNASWERTDWWMRDGCAIIGYRKRTEQPAIAPELVERAFALLRQQVKSLEGVTSVTDAVVEAREIVALLPAEPDPDLTLAKSIVGDAEAIALAIKAARENAK